MNFWNFHVFSQTFSHLFYNASGQHLLLHFGIDDQRFREEESNCLSRPSGTYQWQIGRCKNSMILYLSLSPGDTKYRIYTAWNREWRRRSRGNKKIRTKKIGGNPTDFSRLTWIYPAKATNGEKNDFFRRRPQQCANGSVCSCLPDIKYNCNSSTQQLLLVYNDQPT